MRVINLIIGLNFLALGTVGVFLPILPTVPLYLMAAFFLANSNEKLHSKLVNSKFYKENVEPFKKKGKLPKKVKIQTLVTVTIIIGIAFYFMDKTPIGRGVLVIVWLAHMYFIGYKK